MTRARCGARTVSVQDILRATSAEQGEADDEGDHAVVTSRSRDLAAEVELGRIPELLGEMERLRAILWARLALRINRPAPTEDHLLVISDAAFRLCVSKDWLRRHGDRMPFTVRLSAGQIRFSAKEIDRYIASRVGARRA